MLSKIFSVFSRHREKILFALIALGITGLVYFPKYQTDTAKTSQLAAILTGPTESSGLGQREKTANCAINGPLPDRKCTPGAIFPEATIEKICVSGYTQTVRNVSTKLRKQVYQEYGIPYPMPRGSFEVDHLIPLALGGNNDIANLFPEAAEPTPGFREKDIVEVYLQEQVCSGKADLKVAQKQIAEDWTAIYNNLSPEDIARIKAKYGKAN